MWTTETLRDTLAAIAVGDLLNYDCELDCEFWATILYETRHAATVYEYIGMVMLLRSNNVDKLITLSICQRLRVNFAWCKSGPTLD